jgi:hypothetical protein
MFFHSIFIFLERAFTNQLDEFNQFDILKLAEAKLQECVLVERLIRGTSTEE